MATNPESGPEPQPLDGSSRVATDRIRHESFMIAFSLVPYFFPLLPGQDDFTSAW